MSNLWGQPRPENEPTPAPDAAIEPTDEPDEAAEVDEIQEAAEIDEIDDAAELDDAELEVAGEPIADEIEPEPGSEPPIEIVIEPVATRDDLPTMAQLDALSADLDEIDAALAAMDADPSLPGRATGQRT